MIKLRLKIITHQDDGCMVDVLEQDDGMFVLNLILPYSDYSTIASKTVPADQIAAVIDGWYDY